MDELVKKAQDGDKEAFTELILLLKAVDMLTLGQMNMNNYMSKLLKTIHMKNGDFIEQSNELEWLGK